MKTVCFSIDIRLRNLQDFLKEGMRRALKERQGIPYGRKKNA